MPRKDRNEKPTGWKPVEARLQEPALKRMCERLRQGHSMHVVWGQEGYPYQLMLESRSRGQRALQMEDSGTEMTTYEAAAARVWKRLGKAENDGRAMLEKAVLRLPDAPADQKAKGRKPKLQPITPAGARWMLTHTASHLYPKDVRITATVEHSGGVAHLHLTEGGQPVDREQLQDLLEEVQTLLLAGSEEAGLETVEALDQRGQPVQADLVVYQGAKSSAG